MFFGHEPKSEVIIKLSWCLTIVDNEVIITRVCLVLRLTPKESNFFT